MYCVGKVGIVVEDEVPGYVGCSHVSWHVNGRNELGWISRQLCFSCNCNFVDVVVLKFEVVGVGMVEVKVAPG